MKQRECPCGSPAVNPRGPAVCDRCRKPRKSYDRKVVARVCRSCGQPYRSKSGNLDCPRCVRATLVHACARCGSPCDRRAVNCRRCTTSAAVGEANPNWRGGRTINSLTGYARVRMPAHPRSSNGYVLEHVLVMEQRLGRYLLPGETVHHRNGQRDDNRPENLELWVKSQPAGQRAIDLVEWARTILDSYGDLVAHDLEV